MSFLLERRLRSTSSRLTALREELRVAEEQLAFFVEITEDSRIRSLVSETPLADEEHRDAERSSSAMQRHATSLRADIAKLEAEQDDLLDQLMAKKAKK